MRLTVTKKHSDEGDLWECYDERGERHRVDLLVCGTKDRDAIRAATFPFVVEIDYLFPYIELCNECRLVQSAAPGGADAKV